MTNQRRASRSSIHVQLQATKFELTPPERYCNQFPGIKNPHAHKKVRERQRGGVQNLLFPQGGANRIAHSLRKAQNLKSSQTRLTKNDVCTPQKGTEICTPLWRSPERKRRADKLQTLPLVRLILHPFSYFFELISPAGYIEATLQ